MGYRKIKLDCASMQRCAKSRQGAQPCRFRVNAWKEHCSDVMYNNYRKRGSVSYIVREWLLWVVERERERRLWRQSISRWNRERQSISRWNREWSCIWLPRRRVANASTRKRQELKKLGAWALEQQGRVIDEWRWVAEALHSLVSLPFAGEPAVIYPVPFRVDRTRRRVQSLSSVRVHVCSLVSLPWFTQYHFA